MLTFTYLSVFIILILLSIVNGSIIYFKWRKWSLKSFFLILLFNFCLLVMGWFSHSNQFIVSSLSEQRNEKGLDFPISWKLDGTSSKKISIAWLGRDINSNSEKLETICWQRTKFFPFSDLLCRKAAVSEELPFNGGSIPLAITNSGGVVAAYFEDNDEIQIQIGIRKKEALRVFPEISCLESFQQNRGCLIPHSYPQTTYAALIVEAKSSRISDELKSFGIPFVETMPHNTEKSVEQKPAHKGAGCYGYDSSLSFEQNMRNWSYLKINSLKSEISVQESILKLKRGIQCGGVVRLIFGESLFESTNLSTFRSFLRRLKKIRIYGSQLKMI